jgi:phenylalanyl-tRNA synthetase beta chain
MKLSPYWLRDFVELPVDNRRLAEDLTSVGIAVEGVTGEGDNTIFEMEIGTNRPDAMNHYGVAREASAIYNRSLKPLEPRLPAPHTQAGDPTFPIEIADEQGCARFTARIICDVAIKPSPARIAQRLSLLEQRPINNAVDATNYVLWEMGKPTHVFDLDLLEGGTIIVRPAHDGETLKTLDGVERRLTAEDLVVADARKAVGLAGVMGGYDTMITDKTRNILIESAWWDPVAIRKTSRRHALHTDASHRFERGADFESTVLSCDRVAELILASGGGQLQGGVIDVRARNLDQAPVALRLPEVRRILGSEIEIAELSRILQNLGFEIIPDRSDESDFIVHIPSWRLDVEREIDLIEEIARLYGYDKFASTLPAFSGAVVDPPDARKDEKLRSTLLALGYNEALSLSFISHHDAETFASAPVLELANPLSEEAAIMRTSLVPGMLSMLAYNLNRGVDNVRLFEAGGVYENSGQHSAELKRVCLGATGSAVAQGVHQLARPISFFDIKGDLEVVLHSFQHGALSYDANAPEYYDPGCSASAVMDGTVVAHFGQIHPDLAGARKLRQDVFIAELRLDRLYPRGLREVKYAPLPKYPAVERDFSFIFNDAVVFEKIQQSVAALSLGELRSFYPVEIFHGGNVPADSYSILLRAIFQSYERTLREEEVAQWSARIIQVLQGLGGTLRA